MLCLLGLSPAFAQGSASVNVQELQIEAPQLDVQRNIRVYLPEGYTKSNDRYPVLYMHDGQNLFDTLTAFSGEWRVDEFLDAQKGQKVIVVGIDHGNENRISELTPFPHAKYGGGGAEAYVDFIRYTLKPHVDASFRSLPAAENTTIAGSSLGGLVSFYAALKFPEVFGNALVFSPSFWFNEAIYDFAEASELKNTSRFYFLGGAAESESMVPDMLKMKALLLKKNFPQENFIIRIVEEGAHNEAFWSREFPDAFQWLFSNTSQVK